MQVLEICPYEPPASGWVARVKLLRRVIEQRGGVCEILDIGPSRKLRRPGCIPVDNGRDYLRKVIAHARRGFIIHTHINGEYFRGTLLALAACVIARRYRQRVITSFHAGLDQPYFRGWKKPFMGVIYRLIFGLSHAVVCDDKPIKTMLTPLAGAAKVAAIPPFSRQYLDYQATDLAQAMEAFRRRCEPLLSTYLCFRPGFFTDVVVEAMALAVAARPTIGLIIVGTGDDRDAFQAALEARGLAANVLLAGDLDRDRFLTLIARSAVHLRTPTSDGMSATVREALALGTPVLASENGTRPPGVVTYRADDPHSLADELDRLLAERDRIAAALPRPKVPDTAAAEVDLLAGTVSPTEASCA